MKFRTTQKEIKANFSKIICVPYCELQNLLHYENPIAYTVRREGWAADIYDMRGGVAIVTGYAPFGNIRPSYELQKKYDDEARKIYYKYKYEEGRKALQNLQKKFVEEVLDHE